MHTKALTDWLTDGLADGRDGCRKISNGVGANPQVSTTERQKSKQRIFLAALWIFGLSVAISAYACPYQGQFCQA
jgi:hypothetical protein